MVNSLNEVARHVMLLSMVLVWACSDDSSKNDASPQPVDPEEEEVVKPEEEERVNKRQGEDESTRNPKGQGTKRPSRGGQSGGGGSGESESDSSGGEDGTPGSEELTCEVQWDRYVAHNEVGDFVKYSSKTVSVFNGQTTEMNSEMTNTVVESNKDQVRSEVVSLVNGTEHKSESAILRPIFLQGCENPPETEEEGDEDITVPAGEFSTHWTVTTTEASGSETTIKSYVTQREGEHILVKTESETTFAAGQSSTTTELIETNKIESL